MKAYLFVVIDTPSRLVTECLIMSEERPSVIGYHRAYGLIHTTNGQTFAAAQRQMLKEIKENPWLFWTFPILNKRSYEAF